MQSLHHASCQIFHSCFSKKEKKEKNCEKEIRHISPLECHTLRSASCVLAVFAKMYIFTRERDSVFRHLFQATAKMLRFFLHYCSAMHEVRSVPELFSCCFLWRSICLHLRIDEVLLYSCKTKSHVDEGYFSILQTWADLRQFCFYDCSKF